MANTLTGLIPTLYEAMDIVARESVGFLPAVYKNTAITRAAKGQTVRYPIVPAVSGEDIVPGTQKDSGDAVLAYADVTLSKMRAFPIRITGEEEQSIAAPGQGPNIWRDRIAQAIRAAVNEIEADLAALYIYASRARMTTGTTLFDSTDKLGALSQIRRILIDNGAQGQELHLVLGSSASALLRATDFLLKVNEAGTNDLLREGAIGRLMGFGIHESAQIGVHTNGDYTDSVVTALALGGTAITGTSLGGNLKGDLLKIANDDDNVYVLNADASATAGVINAPGSKIAHSAATDAITPLIATSFIPNMAFARSAIHLATRPPKVPTGGDEAADRVMVSDPITGLTFELAAYKQYLQTKYELQVVWGVAAVKPDFIALLAE